MSEISETTDKALDFGNECDGYECVSKLYFNLSMVTARFFFLFARHVDIFLTLTFHCDTRNCNFV